MARKRRGQAVHGWLVLDKPVGVTSTAAVGMARRAFDAAKVGHGGTLDPLASGILPLAFGEATKLIAYAMDGRKTYRFTVRWGEQRSTDDLEGEVIARSDRRPTRAEIEAILPRFTGPILQRPPAFSALKVAGERAYDLARGGEAVDLPPRPVEVERLTLIDCPDADHAVFECTCGKGTYIRALGRDFGLMLGCFGTITALRRIAVGPFTEAQSVSLDSLGESAHKDGAELRLLPLATVLDDIPALAVTEAEAVRLSHGQAIAVAPHRLPMPGDGRSGDDDVVCAVCQGQVVALGHVVSGEYRPSRVFNL